jgi:hypothetical protein
MDIRMPELFGWHHKHGLEHRKKERRGLNFLDPYLSVVVSVLLAAVALFTLWVLFYFLVGYLSGIFS